MVVPEIKNPCIPSPCGLNSQCREIGSTPSCSCLPEYVGSPPNCRPECVINQECPSNQACISQKCRDPCLGVCGSGALCQVINHTPSCICPQGFIGDPFSICSPKPLLSMSIQNYYKWVLTLFLSVAPVETDPCNPSPCGSNALCNNGICTCRPEYRGDPYRGCRPECVLNNECPRNKACVRSKCIDPCPGTCAVNGICEVINHIPMCSCPTGYAGNAFISCSIIQSESGSLPIIHFWNLNIWSKFAF